MLLTRGAALRKTALSKRRKTLCICRGLFFGSLRNRKKTSAYSQWTIYQLRLCNLKFGPSGLPEDCDSRSRFARVRIIPAILYVKDSERSELEDSSPKTDIFALPQDQRNIDGGTICVIL